jgi:anti-sigma B factor antagonist
MELTKTYPHSGIAYITLSTHKLDMSNTFEFKKKIVQIAKDETFVVLDISQVDFVDSSGLGAILSFLRDLRTRGGELRLCGVQTRVMAMFELVRMQKIVPIAASAEEALSAFALPKAA